MKKLSGFLVNKKVILFLNGEVPNNLPDLSEYEKIFCTDGAYSYLKKLGIKPDFISGDFDSIDLLEISPEIELIHTPDQDYTDFEKVLNLISQKKYNSIHVYGASGKEQDHFLGNLTAAYKFKNKLTITFIDNYSTYFFLNKDSRINNVLHKTISLYPFPFATEIKTTGLLYPLNKETLTITDRIGTRNKAILNDVEINFKEGELVLFITSYS